MATTLKKAKDVRTAPLAVTGLVGSWLTARETGIHPLGDVTLGAAGAYATRTWNAKIGALGAVDLIAIYLSAFDLSHSLTKKIGAWPSVLAVTVLATSTAVVANSK